MLPLLPLTSCIPVEDLGDYRDRTSLDPQLKGRWKQAAVSPDQTREHGYATGDVSEVVEKEGAFAWIPHPDRPPANQEEPIWPIKTLITGRHRWLAIGQQKAVLVGYQFEGGYLHLCPMGDPVMATYIQQHYADAPNLESATGVRLSVNIKHFDETAFAMLRDYPLADRCTELSSFKFEKLP